jgi:glucokinase
MARALPSGMGDRQTGGAIIGVDVGASSISGGLVTEDGEVLLHVQRRTRGGAGGDAVERLLSVVASVEGEARRRGLTIRGVGVGLPGIVDAERGMMVSDQNHVPELAGVRLADLIRERLGLETWVDNDVNAMALGELRWGAGGDAASLLVLAIGTGVGGALIADGALVRGRDGHAGEFGHVSVMMNGPRCLCGGRGCVAVYAAGAAIERNAQQRLPDHPHSKLLTLAGGDRAGVTTAMVFEAAAGGDVLARLIIDEVCEALATLLGGLLNALNPDRVIITGGVVSSLVPLRDDLLERIARYALPQVLEAPTIQLIPSDKSSSMRGAAALYLYETERRRTTPVEH